MNSTGASVKQPTVYYRLISLWVICEAFAGGIMHGLKIPFTGMIVSSLAVICIVLIARFPSPPGGILKATLIVAIFKLILSPHSPPTAYIAVFFQGMIGQLVFSQKKYFTAAAVILAVLALVESAMQRLLVLVLVYGNSFWDAIDKYIQKLLGSNDGNYSLWLAESYIAVHFITGIFIGWYAARLAKNAGHWQNEMSTMLIPLPENYEPTIPKKKKKQKRRLFLIIAWAILVIMFLQSWLNPAQAVLPGQEVIMIIARSIIIVLTWYLFVSPVIMFFIKKALERKQHDRQHQVSAVMQLLPATYHIFSVAWDMSGSLKGLKRLSFFIKLLLINILYNDVAASKNITGL